MAAASNSTSKAEIDAHLAKHFRDLDKHIGDVERMLFVAEAVFESTINWVGGGLETHIKKTMPEMEGYHIIVLNEDQDRAVNFCVSLLGDAIRELVKAYDEASESRPDWRKAS